ncbi:MAG: HEPN domain-containing protein [Anaerolineales bacterium]|nr:HEPN domain-containing protein [Anaerolineales bacterium]
MKDDAMNNFDIKLYLDRAKQELYAANVNIHEALYAVAISRSYYAMFYAANGLLASIGVARSKHSGVISAFRQHFIKSGLIEAEFGDYLGVGFNARQESDYELFTPIEHDLAVKRLDEARQFVDRVEAFVRSRDK